MDSQVVEWSVRALIGGVIAYFWKRQSSSVTKDEMKEYVDLRMYPVQKSLDKNTEAIEAMTKVVHSVDNSLTEVRVRLDYVQKDDNRRDS